MRVELRWLKKKSVIFHIIEKRDYKLGKEGKLSLMIQFLILVFVSFNDLIFVREFINFVID